MTHRTGDEGSFLGRWSRRKRAADVEPEGAEDPAPTEPEADAITPEELEALPAPHDITTETDITPFLRRGVPKALRTAALRRAWMIHPAIRDHKDPAVDYAWDWNTPGGVPGSAGEVAAKGVADLIQRMTGRLSTGAEPNEAAVDPGQETGSAAHSGAVDTAERGDPFDEQRGGQEPLAVVAPEPDEDPPRKHGGARPV